MALPNSTNDVTSRKLGAVIDNLWTKIKSTFVKKSGDVMTGRLTLENPLSQVFIGTGTAASSASGTYYPAKWNYDLGISTPTEGDQMVIKLPVAGHDYGVYISTDNGTTYFPVARNTGANRLTTQYPNGAYVCVVFEAYVSGSSGSGQVNDIFPVAGGTARKSITTGCWRVINDYDSGNTICQLRTENGRFYAGATGCNPYSLVCLDKDGKYSMLISSGSGTGTSKTINTAGKFKLNPVILYYSANNTTAANALVSSTYATFVAYQQIDTRYSHNYTTTFTANSPLYIECTIDEDGYWSPTTKCITQTLERGKYYIYLGQTYSTAYQLSLAPAHPVYYYDGTNLTEVPRLSKADRTKLDGIASGATKVEASTTNGKIKINGTDTTVYTHPAQTAYSAKGSATKVPKITTDSTGHVTGIEEVTISGVTPASHSHGNIANGGTLTDTAAAAAGNDYVVIRDADNAKIQTSTIKGTDVADAVSKKHSHSTLTLSTTAQAYDGSHTLALPSTDPYTSARTPASHTHGNITNAGTITADTAIASGTKIATVGTDNKVSRSPISFDGSTTTKALTQKGTWESFAKSGDITTAIQALDVSSAGGDGKYISAISETDGKISATATTMDTTPTASSTKAVTSGGIKTVIDKKVDIANASLEGQSTTILAQVQSLASSQIHYKRFYTTSDGGSANISDKPTGTTNAGFVLEAYCNRYVSSSDWRYVVLCYVQANRPKIAWIKNGDTSISWQDLNTNTDTKVTQTADNSSTGTGFEVLFSATADNTTRTEASRKSSKLTFQPSTGTLTATKFSGPLTGNVTGNCSGSSGSCTGNSATATTANDYNPATGTIKTAISTINTTLNNFSSRINLLDSNNPTRVVDTSATVGDVTSLVTDGYLPIVAYSNSWYIYGGTDDGTHYFYSPTRRTTMDCVEMKWLKCAPGPQSSTLWSPVSESIPTHAGTDLAIGTDSSGKLVVRVNTTGTASGTHAFAEGEGTTASGACSHAEGCTATASGVQSHAEGYLTTASAPNSHAEGSKTSATKAFSHAEGLEGTAEGKDSHAEGYYGVASGTASHAEGSRSRALGVSAHSEGGGTVAAGKDSHAEGLGGDAGNNYVRTVLSAAHADGATTWVIPKTTGTTSLARQGNGFILFTGDSNDSSENSVTSTAIIANVTEPSSSTYSITLTSAISGAYAAGQVVWLSSTGAFGMAAHAEGQFTVAAGDASHAEGYNTKAYGTYAHAEGANTLAAYSESHAEGYGTTATAYYAHAEGLNTTASASAAHAEGYNTVANADYSHAEGNESKALNHSAHAEGVGTVAYSPAMHAAGMYNSTVTGAARVTGWGTDNNNRADIEVLSTNGDLTLGGKLQVKSIPNGGGNVLLNSGEYTGTGIGYLQLGTGRFIRSYTNGSTPIIDFTDRPGGSGTVGIPVRASQFIGELAPVMSNYTATTYNFNDFTSPGTYYINAADASTNKPNSGKQVLLVFNYAQGSSSVIYQISLGYYIKARRKYNDAAWTNWAQLGTVS